MSAEAEAASEAYGKAMYLKALFQNMTGVKNVPVTIVTDSNSLKESTESDNSCKDKRTAISVSILREAKDEELISIDWIEGQEQLEDILTKDSVNSDPLRKVIQSGKFH